MDPGDAYTQLIAFLDRHEVHYRLTDHPPEGRTEIVSPMRGNALSQAAKCMLMVKIGKKVTKSLLSKLGLEVEPPPAMVGMDACPTTTAGEEAQPCNRVG